MLNNKVSFSVKLVYLSHCVIYKQILFLAQPLSDRMDEYIEDPCLLNPTNPRVLTLPPAMSAVPCKPLFFDLALNHVTFPSVDHKLPVIERPEGAQQKDTAAGQPAGLTGLVKGLWGWGSKK